jgi:hypothetical protein
MEVNPYESPTADNLRVGSRNWKTVKRLLWALAVLLPANFLSVFWILIAIESTPESSLFNIAVARNVFFVTAAVTLLVIAALPFAVVGALSSKRKDFDCEPPADGE